MHRSTSRTGKQTDVFCAADYHKAGKLILQIMGQQNLPQWIGNKTQLQLCVPETAVTVEILVISLDDADILHNDI